MLCRMALEMVRTEGDATIGTVEVVLHHETLHGHHTYDFLDATTHELTAKVMITFTKVTGATQLCSVLVHTSALVLPFPDFSFDPRIS